VVLEIQKEAEGHHTVKNIEPKREHYLIISDSYSLFLCLSLNFKRQFFLNLLPLSSPKLINYMIYKDIIIKKLGEDIGEV
jgi:hypothetical protein